MQQNKGDKVPRNDPLLPICEPNNGTFELLNYYKNGKYRGIQIKNGYNSDNSGRDIIDENGIHRARTQWNYENVDFEKGNYYLIDTKNQYIECSGESLEIDRNNKIIKPRYHITFNDNSNENTIKIYTFKGNLFVREWYTDEYNNEKCVDFKLDVYDYIDLNKYATKIELNGCMLLGYEDDKDGYGYNYWYQNWNLIIKVWNTRFNTMQYRNIKNELSIKKEEDVYIYEGKSLSEEDGDGFTLLYQTIIENDVFINKYDEPINDVTAMRTDISEHPIKLNHVLIKSKKKFRVIGEETGTIQIRGNFIMEINSEIITGTLIF